MRNPLFFVRIVLAPAIIALGLASLCAPQARAQERGHGPQLPAGEGQQVFAKTCSQCHELEFITDRRDSPAGWKRRVDNMIMRGANIVPKDAETIISYLSSSFGLGMNPVKTGSHDAKPLADGNGKDLVQSKCTLCHDSGILTSATRTQKQWEGTVKGMMGRAPGLATDNEVKAITAYLTANYGQKPK